MTCFSCIFSRKKNLHQQHDHLNEDIPGIENVKLYTYKELKNATADFSPANKVGQGGFGSVYKGRLKDGTVVAIKVLSSESRQGIKEFLTEITVISSIVHENLVRLYGCCAEKAHRMLIYNYLENNSLSQTLLSSRHSGIQFDWRTRVKICVGVARGLAFLHEEVEPHVVHRDIKASNILLDKDYTPKIADFGLAKLLQPDATHATTRVAGTRGYLAPEYAVRGQVTRKSDVYSYGILLLEIVSGRCNTNTRLPYEEQSLVMRTWTLYERGELVNIIDCSLTDDLDVEEACRFLKVGLLCAQETMKLRPSMSGVIRMLIGEIEVDSEKITEPGILYDFAEHNARNKNKADQTNRSSTTSSVQEMQPSPSENTSLASMTFTEICGRD